MAITPRRITALNLAITENFDTLANTAGSTTNAAFPVGWTINETGGGARDNEQYAVDTGSGNTGDTYSYGAAASTDRALGGLQSGTLIPMIGSSFLNDTGATLTSLAISYFGEQWRVGTVNRTDRLDFQYSLDATSLTDGTWTDVDTLDFTSTASATAGALNGNTNRTAISGTISSLSIANGATIWFRWVDFNATGADDGLAIDDFSVTADGTVPLPSITIQSAPVSQAEGNGGGTTFFDYIVTRTSGTGDLTIGYTLSGSGINAANASDFVGGTTGTATFVGNDTTTTIRVAVAADTAFEQDEAFTVTLDAAPSGYVLGSTSVASGTILNDDASLNPTFSIASAPVVQAEGNGGGFTAFTFTVTRSSGTGTATVDFAVTGNGANQAVAADFAGGVLPTGTVSFADGETTAQITISVLADSQFEADEGFAVTLTNPSAGFVVGSPATQTGTITNDDGYLIHDIQGPAYYSPILAADGINSFNTASTTLVTVRAVVTAVDTTGNRTGFYITEETQDWDANLNTSEGIFVMATNDAGTNVLGGATLPAGLAVGDVVTVTARVMEYQSFTNLPITVLTGATAITRVGTGATLPVLTLDASHPIPSAILTNVTPNYFDSTDGPTFDAARFAMSYFETVESMLVRIPDLVAADGFTSTSGGQPFFKVYSPVHADPDQINSRGGYTIAGDPPLSPPDTANLDDATNFGGRTVHDGDVNPDIFEIDFTDFAIAAPAALNNGVSAGDVIGDALGIIAFDFNEVKFYVRSLEEYVESNINGSTPSLEVVNFGAASVPAGFLYEQSPQSLTTANFNVENLDPTDGAARFAAIANAIVNNLRLPDIITLEEIQDNNGAAAGDGTSGTGTDASMTFTMLVNAINSAAATAGSNAVYQWVDELPRYNAEGGEPNGNIRVGFLYNTTRVQLGDGSVAATASIAARRQWTDRIGDNVADAGDLIAYNDAGLVNTSDWSGVRNSLLGQFTFNGNTIFVAGNHFKSKGGSANFWQLNQDLASGIPSNAGWDSRVATGEDLYSVLNRIQTGSPNAGIIAGGDYNDFYFYRPLEAATGYTFANGTARNDGARLTNLTLTLPEAERYTYMFDGRSQAIDHILVNSVLAGVASYDVVHINTGFNDASTVPLSDHDPAVARFDFRGFTETITGSSGNDSYDGGEGNDTFFLQQGGNDTVIGGAGNDAVYFGASYNASDRVDGSGGTDQIALQGNYVGGVTIGTGMATGVEQIALLAGSDTRFGAPGTESYSYRIDLTDGAIAVGGRLLFQANSLRAGETFTLNASAEKDGSVLTYGGVGTDILTGTEQNDAFLFGASRFGATDRVDGHIGALDQFGLQGNYSGASAISFGATQLINIEMIVLLSSTDVRFSAAGVGTPPYSYTLTMNDGNVAAGQRMTVSANRLASDEILTFNGSAETDGAFTIYSGNGADVIIGSQGGDIISGRGGGDQLTGGAGNDVFLYSNVTDSTATAQDHILDFAIGDRVQLTAIDAITGGGNDAFAFIGASAFSNTAGELRAVNVGGSDWLIEGDVNGDGIADLSILLTTADNDPLTSGDFLL